MTFQILPHGGKLVNRVLTSREREDRLRLVASLPKKKLSPREKSDLDMIACGALSPLEGFMGEEDYLSVVNKMRLANGLPWTIPITLSVTKEEAAKYPLDKPILLLDEAEGPLALLLLEQKYLAKKELEAKEVYKTTEEAHPGVAALKKQGEIYLAGKIEMFNRVGYTDFLDYRKDPASLRKIFEDKKWRRIVAFQTRNPIHRAH
ncbi:MAG: sulfate adenylyltransferase, partial [Deltaproteobacteria bacterium]|nr:sulfate adenylyltransferase [Deltaproteobacteria bacterium]